METANNAPAIESNAPASMEQHVGITEDGNMILSPEAEAILEGREPETKKPDKQGDNQAPVEGKQVDTLESGKQEQGAPKKKIKWQGQEVEVEPDKEIELLQKGFDYTQKTMQLQAERDLLAANIGLVKAVEQDPALRKKIAEHLKGAPEADEQPPQFEDPIEQLKWEVRQEVLKEVKEKYYKPAAEQVEALTHQQSLDRVKLQVQADPEYQQVHGKIINYIKSLPPSLQQTTAYQLDQNPQAYLETYNHYRQKIIANKKPEDVQKAPPEPTKRETHAPLLESANDSVGEPDSKAQEKRVKDLITRSRRGDNHALGALIELMG
jgi:hypothetical protein